jgi:predicted Zn-dependent peptidase
MRDVKSVAVGILAAAGSADEPFDARGATHFLEHLLFRRARRRSGAAIARMTDRLGGDCDAYTTKESVAFHARTTAERLDDAFDLLFDLTEAPAFTSEDVDVERSVILEEMAEARDVPEDHLHDTFMRTLWPSHPLGAPILGTEETVRSITQKRLAAWFREVFRPERTLIMAVGAFEPERLLKRLSMRRRPPSPVSPASPAGRPGRRPHPARCLLHIPRPELTQTHLLVGAPTIAYGHPLMAAASLAALILGGGVSSRLWRVVRERHGLAYHVGSGLSLHREAGVSLIEAATAPKNLPRLVRTAARVLKRFVSDGVSPAELQRAKNQVRVEIALGLESTAARREAAVRAFVFRGRPEEPDEVLARVAGVTTGDVAEAAALLFGGLGPAGLGVSGPTLAGATLEDLRGELAA